MRVRQAAALLALVVLFLTPLAAAQTPEEGPKYDLTKEVTIKGTVQEVKQVPNPKGQMGIYLMVKSGGELNEVRLCPNSFLEEFEVSYKMGDELTITGSKVKVGEKEAILAREIEHGNSKMVLRDKQGVPVWTWLKQGSR